MTSQLAPAEARRRAGAIVYLCSLPGGMTVSEECGLSAEDAQLGIAWAIDTPLPRSEKKTRWPAGRQHNPRGGTRNDRHRRGLLPG